MRLLFWLTGLPLVLVLGSILLASGIHDLNRQRAFRDGGETVEGTVVAFATSCYSDGRRRPVTYAFTARGGRELRGSDSVGARTRCRLHEGGPVAVQYLVSDPTVNQIREEGEEGVYVFCIVAGAFVVVFMLAVAAVDLMPNRADRAGREQAASPT